MNKFDFLMYYACTNWFEPVTCRIDNVSLFVFVNVSHPEVIQFHILKMCIPRMKIPKDFHFEMRIYFIITKNKQSPFYSMLTKTVEAMFCNSPCF